MGHMVGLRDTSSGKQIKTFPTSSSTRGKRKKHPTKLDATTRKRRKIWKYKILEDGLAIYHGEPFEPETLSDFVSWHFDGEIGEAMMY